MTNQGRRERGAASVELVLAVPLIVLLLSAMVAGWRIWSARSEVTQASHAAARAASQQTSGRAAEARARAVLEAQLSQAGFDCNEQVVEIDVRGFSVPAGQAAEVRVSVSCRVPLSDLLLPGTPGQLTASGDGVSTLDRFRGRRP